jgi:hypothetical protein
MYHGDTSGHVILFVNSEIILIDFNQKQSKNYSFIIENQLLELAINENKNDYKYVLTPQPPKPVESSNQKYFDKHFWIPLILIIIAVNLILYLFKSGIIAV